MTLCCDITINPLTRTPNYVFNVCFTYPVYNIHTVADLTIMVLAEHAHHCDGLCIPGSCKIVFCFCRLVFLGKFVDSALIVPEVEKRCKLTRWRMRVENHRRTLEETNE